MPPPKQIPAIAPDGTPGYVDAEALQAAVNAGYRPGVAMRAPDGTKGIVTFADLAQARANGYKSEGEYSQPATPPPPDNSPGFVSSSTRFLKGAGGALSNAATGAYHTVTDDPQNAGENAASHLGPLGLISYRMGLEPQIDMGKQAYANLKAGNISTGLGSALAAAVPMAGPAAAQIGTQLGTKIGQGDYAGAAGNLAANAGLALLLKKAGESLPDQGPSPVPAAEVQARSIAGAVNPPSIQNFIEAVQKHGGDVTDYAQRNNIGIRGSLDYSKAARGAADETRAQFRSILDPNADKVVPVGASYQGSLTKQPALGRYATLGDINSRIGSINDLLRTSENAPTEGATMTAQERLGLGQEHGELADTLHQTLGDAAGVPPDSIAALREKMGKLYTIADQSNAAVNARLKLQSNINQGTRTVPQTASGIAAEQINKFLRGGPMKIADRSLRKAIDNSNLQPTQPIPPPLEAPQAPSPAAVRQPIVTNGGTASYTPPQAVEPQIENNPLIQRIADRNATKLQLAAANQAQATQEFLRAHQLELSSQDAAVGRRAQTAAVRNALTQSNQAGAAAEVIKANQLDSAAQDASTIRSQRATGLRASRVATRVAGTKLEGEAARTIGRDRVRNLLAGRNADGQ